MDLKKVGAKINDSHISKIKSNDNRFNRFVLFYFLMQIRVSFRNAEGFFLFSATFNTTGSSSTDWLDMIRVIGNATYTAVDWEKIYTRYTSQFEREHSPRVSI